MWAFHHVKLPLFFFFFFFFFFFMFQCFLIFPSSPFRSSRLFLTLLCEGCVLPYSHRLFILVVSLFFPFISSKVPLSFPHLFFSLLCPFPFSSGFFALHGSNSFPSPLEIRGIYPPEHLLSLGMFFFFPKEVCFEVSQSMGVISAASHTRKFFPLEATDSP